MSLLFSASQYILRTNALAGDTTFTYMARIKINPANVSQSFDILSEYESTGRSSFRINWDNGQILGILQYRDTLLIIIPVYNTIQTGFSGAVGDTWYHVAATFQNRTLTMYVNGAPSNPVSHSETTLTPASAVIGAQRTGTSAFTGYMRGEIRDVRLYSTALNPEQVQTISTLRENDNIVDGLVARWSCQGPSGATAITLDDLSVNNYGLTVSTSITYG